MKRVLLLLLILGLIGTFFVFDLDRYFTLEALQQNRLAFAEFRAGSPWLAPAIFFVIYVLITAVSLPGAAIMTLAAGALFGLFEGTLLVSFASSIGATLAFLVSRFILHDFVQQRFGDRLRAINDGVKKEGALYLFVMRLVPAIPFFLINLLMGLTPIRTRTFYWVSQVGMLAGTLVYVNAGTQLAQVENLSDILSPQLWLSFILLGIFPFFARRVATWIRRRRLYGNWKRPAKFDRNLIVIGAGAAGLVSAYIAATVKAKVTLVEAREMGGDCLNYGCVPSKALIRSARLVRQIRHGENYGLDNTDPRFSFRRVMARVAQVIRDIAPHDSVERYTNLGVEVLQGRARITDPWTVEIAMHDGSRRTLTSRSIVIATGAQPFVPPLPGLDEVGYVTSDNVWSTFAEMEAPPARLVILGGGPIGCEMAQCFARFGSHVMQIERGPRIMAREDAEISELAHTVLTADGVEILTGHQALRCEKEGESKFIVLEHESEERRIAFDALFCAVGRTARLTGYGLEDLNIPTERTITTNDYLETLYPNIYAAGDVAGPYQFTHTAAHQAWYATVNALFGSLKRFRVDYSVVPWTTFIDPEVARVGLNEQDAMKQGIAYEVVKYDLAELDRAITDSATRGFVKVLTVPGKDRILGVTIVAEHAGELLAEFVLAMKHGLGLNKILGTIHTYPTMAEANKYAAGAWKKAHAPQRLLNWVERYHTWRRG